MKKLILLVSFIFSNFNFAQINSELINKTIKENQNTANFDSISKILGYKGGDIVRVSTMFIVTKTGEIDSIVAKGPHSIFENEAIRLIKKIPPLNPAVVNDTQISQRFALPINFVIETEKQRKKRIKRELKALKNK
ncbi:energy transducer TonB [Maribacter sp. SA7]|uniref:energy transducer TonB n=1 Tax=Maribacter zhoushanensis TaxID=3030012 RepID=UPI0023EC12AA|nr:energy transducer TonB [Maribacter zhoushanensis]MDF4204404.1 energy transducer TonB [Maribacter zhoushanensis]